MTIIRLLDRPANVVAATALSAIIFTSPAGAAASDVAQAYGGGNAVARVLLAQAGPTQAAPAEDRRRRLIAGRQYRTNHHPPHREGESVMRKEIAVLGMGIGLNTGEGP